MMFTTVFACLIAAAGCSTIPPSGEVSEVPCICTMEFAPVCGVDGKTYGNRCTMNCSGVELLYEGECLELCKCPKDYRPVCGQDGKTYPNVCLLNCEGVAFFQDGECTAVPDTAISKRQDACVCTFEYLPVCGSDGITYGNKCNLECDEALALLHDGPCDGTETISTTTTNISE